MVGPEIMGLHRWLERSEEASRLLAENQGDLAAALLSLGLGWIALLSLIWIGCRIWRNGDLLPPGQRLCGRLLINEEGEHGR